MSTHPEILIGNQGSDYVRFYNIGKPNQEDWFAASVEVQCDGWCGKFRLSFQKGELRRFSEELEILRLRLVGVARQRPMEENIVLDVAGDGKGHSSVKGEAVNTGGRQTKLTFEFEIDQTYLSGIVDGLLAADPA